MIKVIFTLFNLQGTALGRRSATHLLYHIFFRLSSTFFRFFRTLLKHTALFRSLMKFSTLADLCQELFRSPPKNFHAPLLGRILRFSPLFYPNFIGLCSYLFAALSSAWIYYHTQTLLSTPFFTFFQISFLRKMCRPFGRHRRWISPPCFRRSRRRSARRRRSSTP